MHIKSYKYCIIIAVNSIKISKTSFLNKRLLSLSVHLSVYCDCASVAFLNGRYFSVLAHSTLRNLRYFLSSIIKSTTTNLYQVKTYANPSKVKFKLFRNSPAIFRSIHRRCSTQKVVLKNLSIFTEKQLWWSLFFNNVGKIQACNFITTQVFSCEICKIFQNTFLTEHL